ncbi:MAG: 4-amino-4-deoxy-L-arabinose transferase-like glycosyltransferase [Chlamydiales bacterium]|jgi:4-amino-4-deoxy-L-arabinose transferase-like glycosyltransferase
MASSPDAASAPSAGPRWLTPTSMLLYAACAVFLWAALDWRPEWDGSVYLLLARSLAAGDGYLYQGEPFYLRPPGLSWLLSFMAQDGSFDAQRVNQLLMFFATTSVFAIYLATRDLHDRRCALVVALLSGTSLLFSQLFNSVFAEFPFVTFSLLATAALERSVRARERWWIWAALGGVALASAILMRTVGVLLLPGVLLVPLIRCRGRDRWRGVMPVLLTCALTMPWWQHSRAVSAQVEVPVEQDLLFDYATALFRVDPGDPNSARVDLDGWIERITANCGDLMRDLTESTLHISAGPVLQIGLLMLLAVGLGCALRRRGPSMLEWLGIVYVPLIATYFVYDKRLVMPLVPLVYLYLASAFRCLVTFVLPQRRARVLGFLLAIALLTVNLVALSRELEGRTHAGKVNEQIARGVLEHTPPDARILCNQAPTVALLTGRRTFTYRFLRSADILAKYEIDYVLYDTPGTPPPLKRMVDERMLERWAIPFGNGRSTQLTRIR